jgi:hypothetical protein
MDGACDLMDGACDLSVADRASLRERRAFAAPATRGVAGAGLP